MEDKIIKEPHASEYAQLLMEMIFVEAVEDLDMRLRHG